jgi:6-pyruvoyltetrahydropterin/6-carboxytetrahydropterin synthase
VPYRICKTFRVENAHMLTKHPEQCKHPHGHSRKIEVVLSAAELNAQDMVCDFKAVKLAIGEFIHSFDHAVCVNSADPFLPALQALPGARVITFPETDPTTEVMARHMFHRIRESLQQACAGQGAYPIGAKVRLERIRVWETPDSWAEYTEE